MLVPAETDTAFLGELLALPELPGKMVLVEGIALLHAPTKKPAMMRSEILEYKYSLSTHVQYVMFC